MGVLRNVRGERDNPMVRLMLVGVLLLAFSTSSHAAETSQDPDAPGRAALRQLEALDSAIRIGVTPRQYSQRVVDSQLAITNALDAWRSPSEPDAKIMIDEALRVHLLAAQLLSNPKQLFDQPAWLSEVCPQYDKSLRNFQIYSNADTQKLWKCTAMKLDRVRELLNRRKP